MLGVRSPGECRELVFLVIIKDDNVVIVQRAIQSSVLAFE